MIFSDLITLAKAGFTPSDVREFLNSKDPEPLSGSEPETEKTAATDPDPDPEPAKTDPMPVSEPNNVTPEPEQVDYKAQYEQAVEALKKAQAANTRQELPTKEDSGQIFAEAVAGFM